MLLLMREKRRNLFSLVAPLCPQSSLFLSFLSCSLYLHMHLPIYCTPNRIVVEKTEMHFVKSMQVALVLSYSASAFVCQLKRTILNPNLSYRNPTWISHAETCWPHVHALNILTWQHNAHFIAKTFSTDQKLVR